VKPVAVLQYFEQDGVAFFGEHLRARGVAIRLFEVYKGQSAPATLEGFGGLSLLGGPMSVNDEWDALRDSERLVREAIGAGVPVIGHCLGGQLISSALGGQVRTADHAEIGWSQIRAEDHALARHWFGRASFPMFQWHNESFSVPAGAELIATGTYCRHQAYAIGELHLGMQFHCEVDRAKIESWLDYDEYDDIERFAASPAVSRSEAIRAQTDRLLDVSQQTAVHLYDRWLDRLVK
jgi:GMP synthase-like glutamine amidotransferase